MLKMQWNKDKSILLSQVCLVIFALCLLALDIGAYRLSVWFIENRFKHFQSGRFLMLSIYTGSGFGWICLYRLWRLLCAVRQGALFTRENVNHMRVVSWCCFAAAIICAFSAVYYLPFAFVAVAASFMGLIVRIVKNAFEQAIYMKDELDLTV